MHLINCLKSGWLAGRVSLCNEIRASDIQLSMLNEEGAYPPHFTIEVLGTAATESDVLLVTLSGADRELELQKPLEVTGRIVRTGTMSSINSGATPFMPLKILDRNITGIIQYLNIDYLRPVLTEQGTILSEEHELLVLHGTFPDGNKKGLMIEALVGILRRKGCGGIQGFIQALDRTSGECLGHRDIINILKEDPDYDYIMNSFEA